jgi:hypothetical protein
MRLAASLATNVRSAPKSARDYPQSAATMSHDPLRRGSHHLRPALGPAVGFDHGFETSVMTLRVPGDGPCVPSAFLKTSSLNLVSAGPMISLSNAARAQSDASPLPIRPSTASIANFQNVFGRRFMTRAKATFVFWWSGRKDPTSACKRVPEVRRRTVGHEIARSVSPSCLRSESAAAPAYSCRRPWLAEPASVRPRWTSSASRAGARGVRRGSYRRRRSSVDYGP